MRGWIIALGIILFFVLLGFLKIGVVIGYSKEFTLAVKLLFFKIKLVPGKEKKIKLSDFSKKNVRKYEEKERKKKEKQERKKKEKKEKKAQEKEAKRQAKLRERAGDKPKNKKKLSEKINDTVTLVKVILDVVRILFSKLFGYIKTEVLSLKLAIGAAEPDKTAIMYGATMAGVTALLEFLDGHSELKIKDRDAVCVLPDFPSHGFEADINIIISFRLWQVFGMIFPPVIRAAKHFIPKLLKDNKEKAKDSDGKKGHRQGSLKDEKGNVGVTNSEKQIVKKYKQ